MRRRGFYTPWRRAVDAVFAGTDLEGLVVQEMRHTFAALAIAAGAHPQTIKVHLGHSSITTTMDRYEGLFPRAHDALAESLDVELSSVSCGTYVA